MKSLPKFQVGDVITEDKQLAALSLPNHLRHLKILKVKLGESDLHDEYLLEDGRGESFDFYCHSIDNMYELIPGSRQKHLAKKALGV